MLNKKPGLKSISNTALKFMFKNMSWFIVIIFIVVLSIINDRFLTVANLRNLLIQSTILGILVLGESLCFLVGYFDIAVESTMIFSLVFSTWLMVGESAIRSALDFPVSICIIIGLLMGVFIGFLQAFFIVKVKMNAFITTLATYITIGGLSVLWLKGGVIYPLDEGYRVLGHGTIGIVPNSVILTVFLYLIFYHLLNNTSFGLSVYAVGGNPDAARTSGINVDRIIMTCFMLSGLMSAIAGWILAGRMNSASPLLSQGIVFNVFAAAVVGGISLTGGVGNIIGAFGGVLVLVLINNALNLMDVNPYWVAVVRGLVILFAIFIDSMRARK